MASANLFVVCISAFAAVFLLLAVLAMVMRLITAIFPQRSGGADAAVVAAITSTISTIYPNSRITNIEERR
ncbi:MAG: hypothetical protein ABIJ61_14395 [bacterium]